MLEFRSVTKQYKRGIFGTELTKAVDDVSFSIEPNERIGLLGESGCGKSTIARLSTRLIAPTKGEVLFEGKNINRLSGPELKSFRKNVQIVFQNPQQAFNPRMKLYDSIAEPLRIYGLADTSEEEHRMIYNYMEPMGLTDEIFTRYPQEISGGQAQRIAIMRILMLEPKLIIADEPTTMLDVSVQAQILNLLQSLMNDNNTALLFVSHDLDVIRAMCKKIAVMKDGRLCEINTTENIFQNPRDEYTEFLVGRRAIMISA